MVKNGRFGPFWPMSRTGHIGPVFGIFCIHRPQRHRFGACLMVECGSGHPQSHSGGFFQHKDGPHAAYEGKNRGVFAISAVSGALRGPRPILAESQKRGPGASWGR